MTRNRLAPILAAPILAALALGVAGAAAAQVPANITSALGDASRPAADGARIIRTARST